MDWSILHALNEFLHRNDGVEDPLVFYVNVSEALFAATLAIVFLAAQGERWREWRRAATAAALSAGVALAAGSVISGLVDRARPFVADPGQVHLFVTHGTDPSFPSDHATGAFAVAMAIGGRVRGNPQAANIVAWVSRLALAGVVLSAVIAFN